MGAIVNKLENLVNTILDIVVIKTGIVISEEQLLEILNLEHPNNDIFKDYEQRKKELTRIRSEDFDNFCWSVRKNLGELETNINPFFLNDVDKYIDWHEKGYNISMIYERFFQLATEKYESNTPNLIDPTDIVDNLVSENIAPLEIILDILKNILNNQKMSNYIKPVEEILWDGGVKLDDLFIKEHIPLDKELFIDQKFINYLEANPEKLEYMHWRNFERLTAEFFKRQDYFVELGPGTNDGGVDIRVFSKTDFYKPYVIIQCKRHKKSNKVKIETIKSFYTDVDFENAKKGLIATTSYISCGGKKTVAIRKYPLEFAENKEIIEWVKRMTKR